MSESLFPVLPPNTNYSPPNYLYSVFHDESNMGMWTVEAETKLKNHWSRSYQNFSGWALV